MFVSKDGVKDSMVGLCDKIRKENPLPIIIQSSELKINLCN